MPEKNGMFLPSSDCVVAVKLVMSGKAKLGLAEYCQGDVWSITTFDKSVRAKDVRAMDANETFDEKTLSRLSLDDIIASSTIQPNWTLNSNKHFSMTPPCSIQLEKTLHVPTQDYDSQIVSLSAHTPMKRATSVPSVLYTKYYETLYVAQTSVSYFAKSSLSRIRAMCKEKYQALDDTPKQSVAYVEKMILYLRAMILNILDLDSKYDAHNFWHAAKSSEFLAFSREEQVCIQKWANDLEEKAPGFSVGTVDFKNAIEQLKTREIQLQIIILMEVLALETQRDQIMGKVTRTSPTPKQKANAPKKGLVRLKKKSKEVQKAEESDDDTSTEPNTQTLAIAMFDRLCIRNLSSGGPDKYLGETQYKTPAQAAAAADKTQEFCREAIMPFFGARLPELCKKLVQSCRGNSTGLVRQPTAKPSASHVEPAQRTETVTSGPRASRTGSLASLSEMSQNKAGKTFRGGLSTAVNLRKAEERGQVEMTFRSSQHLEEEVQEKGSRLTAKALRMHSSQQITSSFSNTQNGSRQAQVKTSKLNVVESRTVEVEGTPMKRKRQLTVHQPKTNTHSQVLIEGRIYSTGDDSGEEDLADDVILETPAKRSRHSNFNDRLAASLSASRNQVFSDNNDYDEIISSPTKTPYKDPGLDFSNTTSSEPGAQEIQPLNPIYDQNLPRFYSDKSPLGQRQRNVLAGLSSSPSRLDLSAGGLTNSAKKRKSQQWFDDAFPTTKSSTSNNLF